MWKRGKNRAIDRSKIARQAKPLGDFIVKLRNAKLAGAEDPFDVVRPPAPKPKKVRKRRTPKENRETALVQNCLIHLKRQDIFAWRNNTGTLWVSGRVVSFGKKGSADIIGLLPDGRFLGIECKVGANKQNDKQREFQQQIESNNGVYLLVYTLDELKMGLSDILKRG